MLCASQIAAHFKASLSGSDVEVSGLSALKDATSCDVALCYDGRFLDDLKHTKAGLVIVSEARFLKIAPCAAIQVDHPRGCLAYLAEHLCAQPVVTPGIDKTARVHPTAQIAQGVSIGPYVVVGARVSIGCNVQIASHCVLAEDVEIGAYSKLDVAVVLHRSVSIGSHCVIGTQSVIGACGFGFERIDDQWQALPHVGSVQIDDRVSLGSQVTIDRGLYAATWIQSGVKIDSKVHIGHNAVIGQRTIVAGCTGISGSVTIGCDCMIGGGVGIADHVELADGVVLLAGSHVMSSVNQPGTYGSGLPLQTHRAWAKCLVGFKKLPALMGLLSKKEKVKAT